MSKRCNPYKPIFRQMTHTCQKRERVIINLDNAIAYSGRWGKYKRYFDVVTIDNRVTSVDFTFRNGRLAQIKARAGKLPQKIIFAVCDPLPPLPLFAQKEES